MQFAEDYLGKHPYFGGAEFSAADIMMVFPLNFGMALNIVDKTRFPNINAWKAKMEARPAYQRMLAKARPDGMIGNLPALPKHMRRPGRVRVRTNGSVMRRSESCGRRFLLLRHPLTAIRWRTGRHARDCGMRTLLTAIFIAAASCSPSTAPTPIGVRSHAGRARLQLSGRGTYPHDTAGLHAGPAIHRRRDLREHRAWRARPGCARSISQPALSRPAA
jgi:hypothetical protein